MIARYAGAGLGFLAFTITAFSGLAVQNPVTVTLSRSILAFFLFTVIGFVLGTAAELVVREYRKNHEANISEKHHERKSRPDGAESPTNKDDERRLPAGT